MSIDLAYESDYYRREQERSSLIHAALQREDVQQALARCPDASGLSACATAQGVLITAFASLETDPAIAEIASDCDGDAYLLSMRQTLLEVAGEVTVSVQLSGRWPLQEAERELLRRVGKLQTETSTREYLSCAV